MLDLFKDDIDYRIENTSSTPWYLYNKIIDNTRLILHHQVMATAWLKPPSIHTWDNIRLQKIHFVIDLADHSDGFAQDGSISIIDTLDILQPCTKQSIWRRQPYVHENCKRCCVSKVRLILKSEGS